jgi:hypothetical protein
MALWFAIGFFIAVTISIFWMSGDVLSWKYLINQEINNAQVTVLSPLQLLDDPNFGIYNTFRRSASNILYLATAWLGTVKLSLLQAGGVIQNFVLDLISNTLAILIERLDPLEGAVEEDI